MVNLTDLKQFLCVDDDQRLMAILNMYAEHLNLVKLNIQFTGIHYSELQLLPDRYHQPSALFTICTKVTENEIFGNRP